MIYLKIVFLMRKFSAVDLTILARYHILSLLYLICRLLWWISWKKKTYSDVCRDKRQRLHWIWKWSHNLLKHIHSVHIHRSITVWLAIQRNSEVKPSRHQTGISSHSTLPIISRQKDLLLVCEDHLVAEVEITPGSSSPSSLIPVTSWCGDMRAAEDCYHREPVTWRDG